MESKIIKALVVLGVPGVALGILYLLFNSFNFKFAEISGDYAALIAIVFLVIVGGIIFYALHRWAPINHRQHNHDNKELTANSDMIKSNELVENAVKMDSVLSLDSQNVISNEADCSVLPPTFFIDWPNTSISDEELQACLDEAAYRANNNLSPVFNLKLVSKDKCLSEIESLTENERSRKIELLSQLDYYNNIEKDLETAIRLIVDENFRQQIEWRLIMDSEYMMITAKELLSPKSDGMRVKLANINDQLSTGLQVDPDWFQERFNIKLSNYSESTLSVTDTNYKKWEIFDLDFSFVRRVLGAVLRMSVQTNKSPLEFSSELNLENWLLTGD